MQIVRLSNRERVEASEVQVLVDPEGEVHLFWIESDWDELEQEYVLRSLYTDGSWGDEERIGREILYHSPVFLLGEDEDLCYTFSDNYDSHILKMTCRTSAGWKVSSLRGYADQILYQIALFLDGPRIITAYTTFIEGNSTLYFGETRLTGESTEIYNLDLAKDQSGGYHLVYTINMTSDKVYRMRVMDSQDQGRSWSESDFLSEKLSVSPHFYLAQDGTLYLIWMEFKKLMIAADASGSGWETQEIPVRDDMYLGLGEVFLEQDAGGEFHIFIWDDLKMYTLHGSFENGFSEPVCILDQVESNYLITKISSAVGLDGTMYVAWSAFNTSDYSEEPAFFGWLPNQDG